MTLKSFTKKDKKGREETWEWEETPELLAAIEQLQKSTAAVEALAYKPKKLYVGTKNYAPQKKTVV